MRSVIDTVDLTVEELDGIIKTACDISENPQKYAEVCKGKKLATLFFEPSTRTRLSFEAAMYELGGNVIGWEGAGIASAKRSHGHRRANVHADDGVVGVCLQSIPKCIRSSCALLI